MFQGAPRTERLNYSPEFLDRCTSLFLGFESGHMGADMYQAHEGVRIQRLYNDIAMRQTMSGVFLWDMHAKYGTIPRAEKKTFLSTLKNIAERIEVGTPLVEFGPGSAEDTRKYVEAVNSKLYVPVDASQGIIDRTEERAIAIGCEVKPVFTDIFADGNVPVINMPSFGIFSGLTIGNTPGGVPKSEMELHDKVVRTFRNLSNLLGYGGYLAISARSEQNGERNKRLYNEYWHSLFGVNFLYRMQVELPVRNFNPDYFEYNPVWHEQYSLLAHTVRATRNQNFIIVAPDRDIEIAVNRGDIFHFNNSYNHPPAYLENCARDAGLLLNKRWVGDCCVAVYLFDVPNKVSYDDIDIMYQSAG